MYNMGWYVRLTAPNIQRERRVAIGLLNTFFLSYMLVRLEIFQTSMLQRSKYSTNMYICLDMIIDNTVSVHVSLLTHTLTHTHTYTYPYTHTYTHTPCYYGAY